MTDDELRATVRDLNAGMATLGQEWKGFLDMEIQRREADATRQRKHEDSESNRAAMDSDKAQADADSWQKSQTFFGKHGTKILSLTFAGVASGLAWYGGEIRSEMDSQQRAIAIDKDIGENSTGLIENAMADAEFKAEAKATHRALKDASVDTTLMMDKGFRRMDTVMLKASRLNEKDLPEYPPEFNNAVEAAERLKLLNEKFPD